MIKTILASSQDSKYAAGWVDDVKKLYPKDNLFYKYLDTGDTIALTEIIRQTEDVFPPMAYFDFMNDPNSESALHLVSSLFDARNKVFQRDTNMVALENKLEKIKVGGGNDLFDGVDDVDIYEHYAKIDCLHDIGTIGNNTTKARFDFAKRLGVTDKVAHTYSTMTKKYTKHICNELLENDVVYSLSSKTNSKALFTPSVFDIFEKQTTINIVMDSLIWRRCKKHNVQNGFMAAFLLLSIEGMNSINGTHGIYKVKPAKKSGVQNINFIMGKFMDVDGTPLIHFVDKFIKKIADISGASVQVVMCEDKPNVFTNMIGNVDFDFDKLVFKPNDKRESMSVKFYPSYKKNGNRNRMKSISSINSQPTLDLFLKKLSKSWCIPYSKVEFEKMMTTLNEYKEDKATDMIKTFAEMNFLRDSWKIYVALQNNALLLTSDMLLYTLLQKMGGDGVCFHVKKYELENNKKFVFEVDVRQTI